jgi:2-hydroxycyclohexanecarboxyl-CoA dehydrogenase
MDLGLTGKTVIVTGGASHIGRAISLGFASEGSNVVIADIDEVQGKKVANEANALGGHAIAIKTDVTKFGDVEEMVQKTLNEFLKIDVLVNNFGWNVLGLFTELDRQWWDTIIARNYVQILNCFKAVLPLMIGQKSGSIVSMSTVIARKGHPNHAVNAGLKAGIISFSRCIAQQVARDKIRINIVAPGLVPATDPETLGRHSVWKDGFTPEQKKQLIEEAEEVIPMGKVAKPTDIAYAVLFLASDVTAGHITGQVLGVDGGLYMGW